MGVQRLSKAARIRILLSLAVLLLSGCGSPPADDPVGETVQGAQGEGECNG